MPVQLKTYRLCTFDAVQRSLNAELIEADSDEAAIALAEEIGFGTKCEIWDGNRLVAALEAERRQA
jgi:hypothetical protein